MIFGVSLLHVQLHVKHEIGGVTSSGEDSLSDNSLVHGTSVGVSRCNQILIVRNQVQKRHLGEQLLVERLLEHLLLGVPTAPLNVETIYVGAIICGLARIS